jgi:hypothetical protein
MSDRPLPSEYTPFSLNTVEEGRTYGTLSFSVNQESHDKAVSLLLNGMEHKPLEEEPYPLLLPSELWAMARVFSQSFGRLNEVGLARSVWRIFGSVEPTSSLTATATVLAKIPRERVALCATRTDTCDAMGNLLMRADDKVVMAHDCKKPFFVEPPPVSPSLPHSVLYRNRHTVYFRYGWDPAVWSNNIHVDEYARLCGFERALPEFVVYMDWIYHAAVQCGWVSDGPFSISLHKILPMYLGERIDVVAYETPGCLHIRLLKAGMERMVARVRKG